MKLICKSCNHEIYISKYHHKTKCNKCHSNDVIYTDNIVFPEMDDNDLKNLAKDIYKNRVFTHKHLKNKDHIKCVFLEHLFLISTVNIMNKKEVGLIYEYKSKGSPRCIGQLPLFNSCNYLNIEQTKKVLNFYKLYKENKF